MLACLTIYSDFISIDFSLIEIIPGSTEEDRFSFDFSESLNDMSFLKTDLRPDPDFSQLNTNLRPDPDLSFLKTDLRPDPDLSFLKTDLRPDTDLSFKLKDFSEEVKMRYAYR